MEKVKSVVCITLLLIMSSACTVENDTVEKESAPMANMLTGTSWWVEDINGAGVIDRSHTTIEFAESGRVSGDTGCNRYVGDYETGPTDQSIRFGPLAGTRKACIAALMDQEQRFYEAMGQSRQWTVAETGLLRLLDEQGNSLIRAFRTEEKMD